MVEPTVKTTKGNLKPDYTGAWGTQLDTARKGWG